MLPPKGGGSIPDLFLRLGNGNGDVAIGHYAVVISLQIDRSRLSLIAVKRASGRSRELDIVVIHLAIPQDGHMPADQGDVESRPFSKTIFRALWGWIPTVDRAHFMRRKFASFGAHL